MTGASGFVGANVARRLVADGHDVHLLLRAASAPWRTRALAGDVRVHGVDLRDTEGVRAAIVDARPEWVFHLAVHGAYPAQTDWRQMVETNMLGTMNVVTASLDAGAEVIVNTGSSSEYGYKDHAPDERELVEPNSYYAVTKVGATIFCRYMAQARGARIPTLRLYSVYGPHEEPTRLVPRLIVNGLAGTLPPLANPDTARDFVYVDDVVDAYLAAAERPLADMGAVLNVGSGVQTKLGELVEIARRALKIEAEPHWGSMAARQWDTSVWVANIARISAELDWAPRRALADGLVATADWLLANPDLLAFYREA
ncbi:MAG: NAD-dependent epimerase/dehydratase family protein [Gemmatimonadaceae bacterium]